MKTNIILVAVLCTQPFSLACAEGTEHEVHYLLGNDWRADKGLMFMKEGSSDDELYFNPGKFEEDGVIDNRRSLFGEGADTKKLCLTLRLQKDFDYEDHKSEPATFNWAHEAGAGDSFEADASLRADFWVPGLYKPDGTESTIALGYDIKRSEADGVSVNVESYHLAVPFAPKVITRNIPFLHDADQVFEADFSYNRDRESGEDGFDFKTNYSPTFRLPGYAGWVGTPCDFDGKALPTEKSPTVPYYNIDPKIGISYGDKYTLGSPTTKVNEEFVASYEIGAEFGTPLGDGGRNRIMTSIRFSAKGAQSLDSGESFNYGQVSLRFSPTQESPVFLEFAYRTGADGFAAEGIERTSIALAAQF